jgi:hypothetical protein
MISGNWTPLSVSREFCTYVNLQQHKPLVPDVTRDLGTIQWLKETQKERIEVGKPYNPIDRRTVRVLLVADGCRN